MSDTDDMKASEEAAPYGTQRRRIAKKPIIVTEEEMKNMDPPCPAEPEWIAELDAEADRREREKSAKK